MTRVKRRLCWLDVGRKHRRGDVVPIRCAHVKRGAGLELPGVEHRIDRAYSCDRVNEDVELLEMRVEGVGQRDHLLPCADQQVLYHIFAFVDSIRGLGLRNRRISRVWGLMSRGSATPQTKQRFGNTSNEPGIHCLFTMNPPPAAACTCILMFS